MSNIPNRSGSAWRSCVLCVLISGPWASEAMAAQAVVAQQTEAGLPAVIAPVALPGDYVIGQDDLLSILFWREPEMSAQVRVRPDGKVSLPLLREVQASGLTPDQLRRQLETEAGRFVANVNATVMVTEINSRRVFVTGEVGRPGAFPLAGSMSVLQAIALAGGLLEFADAKHIEIVREAGGRTTRLRFNYKAVVQGRNHEQSGLLQPGDTVVVR
jgi:polysaccharide export outer membrane protein